MNRLITFFGTQREFLCGYDEENIAWLFFSDAKFTFVWPDDRRGQIQSIDGNAEELLSGIAPKWARGRARITCRNGIQVDVKYMYSSRNALAMFDKPESPTDAEATVKPPELDELIVLDVSRAIMDKLDVQARATPAPSLVFKFLCRDKMTLAGMARKFRWSNRTLKYRKAQLQAFLLKQYKLSLNSFLGADRAIFRGADRALSDYRAKHIRPTAVAECEDANGDED